MSSHKTWLDVWNSSPGPKTKTDYIFLYIKAFCMGIADLVPGVSGGTIAFITGIYDSLLASIASLNMDVFKKLFSLRLKEALSGIHLRFIIPLGLGIVSAMLLLSRLMHYLMNEHKILTWSAFFGLISASIIIVFRHQENPKAPGNLLMMALGAAFGYLMVSLIPVTTPDTLWFIYLCGIIGITAMILPGLSGSFLLLILGKYEYMTGAIKNPLVDENYIILFIFTLGTATGLLSFSKVLNWAMNSYRNLTMAFLTGILVGSMKKVWPWKNVLETKVIRGKTRILREENFLPTQWDGELMAATALIIVGFVSVLFIEYYSEKQKSARD